MTNQIVKHEPTDIDSIGRVAKMMAMSQYFDAKGDNPEAIAKIGVAILAGREMGLGEFASVQGIHIIKGKPTLSANLMAAQVKAHPKYDYRVVKNSDTVVSIDFFEGSEKLGNSSFSVENAKAAGLTNNDNWKKYPRNMLFARAMSNGVKWYVPDVFSGNAVYTPDELDDDDPTNGGFTVVGPEEDSIIESLDDVEEPDAQLADWNSIPDAPSKKASVTLHKAIKAAFPKDTDDARHWLVELYTTAATPDNVRTSSKDLNHKECLAIAKALDANPADYQQRYEEYATAQVEAHNEELP